MSTIDLDLGALLEAAIGLDTSWKSDAYCSGWSKRDPGKPTPWMVAENDTPLDGVAANQLIKYALLGCAGCPAQYNCARWAVQAEVRACTYSMRIGSMRWLQDQEDWEDIIDLAEVQSMPIQFMVRDVRAARA